MKSLVRLIVSPSSAEPIVIAPSAEPGETIFLVPSLPAATTQTIPFSVALLTNLASAPVPLSPFSLNGSFALLPIEPNDICPI